MKFLLAFFVLIASLNLVCSVVKPSISLRPFDNNKCRPTGCFNEICAKASFTPHFCPQTPKPEDQCKKFAKCMQNLNGRCGWTKTRAYKDCLQGKLYRK